MNCAQHVAGMGPECRQPGDDQRPLGAGKQLQGLLDKGRIGLRGGGGLRPGGRGDDAVLRLDKPGKHIRCNADLDRSRHSAGGDAEGFVDVLRNPQTAGEQRRPFGDRGAHRNLRQLLAAASAQVGRHINAAEHNHRRAFGIRDGNPRHRVGEAWAGRDQHDRRLAGRARPALRDMDQRGFMAAGDDLDALVQTGLVDRKERRAGKREETADAMRLQRPDQQKPACYLFHRKLRFFLYAKYRARLDL